MYTEPFYGSAFDPATDEDDETVDATYGADEDDFDENDGEPPLDTGDEDDVDLDSDVSDEDDEEDFVDEEEFEDDEEDYDDD